MTCSHRNGPLLSVTSALRDDLTRGGIRQVIDEFGPVEQGFSLGQGQLDPGNRVVLVRSR